MWLRQRVPAQPKGFLQLGVAVKLKSNFSAEGKPDAQYRRALRTRVNPSWLINSVCWFTKEAKRWLVFISTIVFEGIIKYLGAMQGGFGSPYQEGISTKNPG